MNMYATGLAVFVFAAVCSAQVPQRRITKNPDGSTTMQESWGHSSFNQESSDGDGIISGRSGYSDSAGNTHDTHYEIGPDGKMKVVDSKDSKLPGSALGSDFLSGRTGFGNFGGFSNPGFGNIPGFGAGLGNINPGFGGGFGGGRGFNRQY